MITVRKPVILTKEVYATSSMIGSVFYYYALQTSLSPLIATIIALAIIFGLRMWTIIKHINLPVVEKK